MVVSEERAQEILREIAKLAELDCEISAVIFREDYRDYIAVVGKINFVDIREKLIVTYNEVGNTNEDVVNEIVFKLKHPTELEEWQIEEMGLSGEITEEDLQREKNKDGKGGGVRDEKEDDKKKIVVDKSEETDWI